MGADLCRNFGFVLRLSIDSNTGHMATGPLGVGDAVGVADRKWYVAIVNNNTEKAVQERLGKLHYESYVAKQTVVRVWKNGRKTKIDKVLLPSIVFVKCTEKERREVVALPYINRFMTNKAGASVNGGATPLAVISQSQIDTLRFMLHQSDIPVTFVDAPYKVSDKIVVIRGSLKGLEGEVLQTFDGKSDLIVRIDILGSAKISINSIDVEPVRR